MLNGTLIAAVDLGSNSFRLEIGRLQHGQIVRQGNGLDDESRLSPEAMQRGWDCLARFGERLAGFAATQVRAVATQTLREARNRDEFLARGSALLGFPIDVVSGPEEARLIYQGVARLLPSSPERRLVVDIGGRSTELILGQNLRTDHVASFPIGSVAWSNRYFPQGEFTSRAFDAAEIAAKAVLEEALQVYRPDAWDTAYGSSGTVGAVGEVLTAMGDPAGKITQAGLAALRERLERAQNVDRLRMEGLKEDRRPVIGGGVSVLCAVMDLLGISEMQVAQGALRQGALYDLLDREQPHTDLRATSVQVLMKKFGVDVPHAERVAAVALELLRSMSPAHAERAGRKLEWAARLHEVGCVISHSDAHKHGAYILENTDAPGFALPELHALSLLVLGHRGKLRKIQAALDDEAFMRPLLCLRLAVILCHARRQPDMAGLYLAQDGPKVSLAVRPGWTTSYPQSAYLLREEAAAWQKTPWALEVELG